MPAAIISLVPPIRHVPQTALFLPAAMSRKPPYPAIRLVPLQSLSNLLS